MTDRPILFSAPMVRALLAGTKTQTRRVVKPQPHHGLVGVMVNLGGADWAMDDGDLSGQWRCPYGVPGDRLIVRETFRLPAEYDDVKPSLVRSSAPVWYAADVRADEGWGKTRVSIHMPRWASRLTLTITEVRVERLQDISEADAKAEGAPQLWTTGDGDFYEDARGNHLTGYAGVWEHINGPGSWAANPWVWAVSFEVER